MSLQGWKLGVGSWGALLALTLAACGGGSAGGDNSGKSTGPTPNSQLPTPVTQTVKVVSQAGSSHFNPEAIIASAGPDVGAQFTGPIGGPTTAEGIMNPSNWYPKLKTYQNAQMVQDYLAKYGGSANDMNVDIAEAYSVGQVLVQAVNKIHSIDNAKIITELHSGNTFQSVQGPVKFNDRGENIANSAFIFQWQKGAFIPVYPSAEAAASPEFPKPNWP